MMKIRNMLIVLLVMLVLNFSSCSPNTNELKKKFEKYTFDNNVIAVLDSSRFYFADHTLNLRDIVNDEEPNRGYLFLDGKIFFSTSKQNGIRDYSFLLYECDTYGNNKKLIFEKHGYKTKPWAIGEQSVFYIEHHMTNALDASACIIDSYDIRTGAYETVETGKDVSLSDYKEKHNKNYLIKINDGIFEIAFLDTNTVICVNEEMLSKSSFAEGLDGINYSPAHFDVINDHIYLTYKVDVVDLSYPHIICEYIPETNEIVFKSLLFLDDIEVISIEYINTN